MNALASELKWSEEQYNTVRDLIAEEIEKARLSHKFIPAIKFGEETRSVPADEYDSNTHMVDDISTIALVELQAPVNLTKLQAEDADLSAALLLIRRAANLLARAHDCVVYRGQEDKGKPPTTSKFPSKVKVADGRKNEGLCLSSLSSSGTEVDVMPDASKGQEYGEALVPAVSKALVMLESAGYIGSYVMVLGQTLFEDATTPSRGSLVLPKDRIEPMLDGPIYRSSVLEDNEGLLISMGGDPMDVAVAVEPRFEFLRIGGKEVRQCRVFERFTLRLKDKNSVIKLVRK